MKDWDSSSCKLLSEIALSNLSPLLHNLRDILFGDYELITSKALCKLLCKFYASLLKSEV